MKGYLSRSISLSVLHDKLVVLHFWTEYLGNGIHELQSWWSSLQGRMWKTGPIEGETSIRWWLVMIACSIWMQDFRVHVGYLFPINTDEKLHEHLHSLLQYCYKGELKLSERVPYNRPCLKTLYNNVFETAMVTQYAAYAHTYGRDFYNPASTMADLISRTKHWLQDVQVKFFLTMTWSPLLFCLFVGDKWNKSFISSSKNIEDHQDLKNERWETLLGALSGTTRPQQGVNNLRLSN